MMLAFRLAARELRGGARGLGIVLLCLALGVAAIAAVGGLRAAVERGLADNGRALLGGDVEVQTGADSPPPALKAWLRGHGARVSDVTQMRSLLVAPSGRRELIDLKAVDAAWPLVGAPVLAPSLPLAEALARHDGRFGLLADPLVLDRLGLKPGEVVRIGTASFVVSAALVSEPDRVAGPALFGGPVVIAAAALPGTGLVVPGAIVTHAIRATVAAPDSAARLASALTAAFPDQGWRVRGPADAAPGVAQFVAQTALFMTLVGLTALLVGGVGVASGTRAWLDSRARSLATLRCLGASARLVFAISAIQAGALAGSGILMGLIVGAAIPPMAAGWLSSALPVPAAGGLYPGPLILAGCYGALTAGCFALPALSRAMRIPGAALFRDGLIPDDARPPRADSRHDRRPGDRAGRACGMGLGGSAVRTGILRRRGAVPGGVPTRWRGTGPRGGVHPTAMGGREVGALQLAPAGCIDAADADLGRSRTVHPGHRGFGPGQYPPRDPAGDSGRRAKPLLHRHPAGPTRTVRRHRSCRARGDGPRAGAQPARSDRQRERCAGRAGPRHPRHTLGVARRSRPDLRGHATARHAPGRRTVVAGRTTTGRRSCRWTRIWPRAGGSGSGRSSGSTCWGVTSTCGWRACATSPGVGSA